LERKLILYITFAMGCHDDIKPSEATNAEKPAKTLGKLAVRLENVASLESANVVCQQRGVYANDIDCGG
jgi:hypothetical protein